jgi:hypothetical protein
MNKDINYFMSEFERQIKKNERFKRKPGNTAYGGNVMPILKMYDDLTNPDEGDAFREALEKFLIDPDEKKRKFAVLVCLGFVVFKNSIR